MCSWCCCACCSFIDPTIVNYFRVSSKQLRKLYTIKHTYSSFNQSMLILVGGSCYFLKSLVGSHMLLDPNIMVH